MSVSDFDVLNSIDQQMTSIVNLEHESIAMIEDVEFDGKLMLITLDNRQRFRVRVDEVDGPDSSPGDLVVRSRKPARGGA